MGLRASLGSKQEQECCPYVHSQTMCANRLSTWLTQLLSAYLDGQLRIGCACDAELRELGLEEVTLTRQVQHLHTGSHAVISIWQKITRGYEHAAYASGA